MSSSSGGGDVRANVRALRDRFETKPRSVKPRIRSASEAPKPKENNEKRLMNDTRKKTLIRRKDKKPGDDKTTDDIPNEKEEPREAKAPPPPPAAKRSQSLNETKPTTMIEKLLKTKLKESPESSKTDLPRERKNSADVLRKSLQSMGRKKVKSGDNTPSPSVSETRETPPRSVSRSDSTNNVLAEKLKNLQSNLESFKETSTEDQKAKPPLDDVKGVQGILKKVNPVVLTIDPIPDNTLPEVIESQAEVVQTRLVDPPAHRVKFSVPNSASPSSLSTPDLRDEVKEKASSGSQSSEELSTLGRLDEPAVIPSDASFSTALADEEMKTNDVCNLLEPANQPRVFAAASATSISAAAMSQLQELRLKRERLKRQIAEAVIEMKEIDRKVDDIIFGTQEVLSEVQPEKEVEEKTEYEKPRLLKFKSYSFPFLDEVDEDLFGGTFKEQEEEQTFLDDNENFTFDFNEMLKNILSAKETSLVSDETVL